MKSIRLGLREYSQWYLFLLIPFVGTIVFNLYPLVQTMIQSLCNAQDVFIGFANFKAMFSDKSFIKALNNTLYMGVLGILMNIPVAFLVAYLLHSITKCRRLFQSIYLLPMVISFVALANLFRLIFAPEPNSLANLFLGLFGAQPLTWFNDIFIVRPLVVFMAVWKGIGFNIIILYAGLQAIPVSHYEAAEIEGVTEWQRVRYITLPGIRNTMIVVWITTWMAVFKRFTDVFALGREYAQPAEYTLTLMFYIYQKSFSQLFAKEEGIAAAASVVLFVLILLVTAFNYFVTEDRDSLRGERND